MEWCERDIPQPGPGELQIKLEYVGVCGSDLHFYSEGRLANWVPDGPLVLGHEPGGVVSAIGEGVTGFEVGDRVALEPGVPCGHCEDCLKGHYNLCRSVRVYGHSRREGRGILRVLYPCSQHDLQASGQCLHHGRRSHGTAGRGYARL